MFSPYKQRPAGASTLFGSPSKKVPLNGCFNDGVWHCNCAPRLPATHFEVKKDSKNKGRWFYTCQLEKEKACGFFLWAEEAAGREGRTLLGNKRSEVETGAHTVEDDEDTTSEEDFGDWPVSPTTQKLMDMGQSVPGAYPETPRKVARYTSIETPGSKRRREEAASDMLPTPLTYGPGIGSGRFIDRLGSTKPGAQDSGENKAMADDDIFGSQTTTTSNMGMHSPSITPTPAQFLPPHNEASPSRPTNSRLQYDISSEVLSLLHNRLDDDTETKVKGILERHALRISGISKGRDITRVALKVKEGKITELEAKIGELEGQREIDRRIIARLRKDIAGRHSTGGRSDS